MKSLKKPLTVLFFGAYLLAGWGAAGDYGAHTDEFIHQIFGKRWGMYVEKTLAQRRIPETCDFVNDIPLYSETFQTTHNLSHGPFWEVVLYEARKLFSGPNADTREVILFRHHANFLLFYVSVIFFYFLCRKIFGSPWLALLGGVILVFHPRIFADSFYNTTDLSFLSFYIISAYTLIRFLDRKNFSAAAWHALACAFLVDTRAIGLMMPFLTVLLALQNFKADRPAGVKLIGIYGLMFVSAMVLFWPFLWRDTFSNFLASVHGGAGNLLVSGEMPKEMEAGHWYVPSWIAATTPAAYLVFFLAGLFGNLFSRVKMADTEKRGFLAAWALFFVPLAATMLNAHLFLYDGWRHHYFIYGPFVILCLFGIKNGVAWIGRLGSKKLRTVVLVAAAVFGLTDLCMTAAFMLRNHPYQFVYTSSLAPAISKASGRFFPFDYWGVSHRQALENILARDRRPRIFVYFPQWKWESGNIAIMPENERGRLQLTEDPGEADYTIVKYDGKGSFDPAEAFFTIYVNKRPITVVYQRGHFRESQVFRP